MTASRAAAMLFAWFCAAGVLAPQLAVAHESRPAYLALREDPAGTFHALWKRPARGDRGLSLSPELSGGAGPLEPVATRKADGAVVQTWRFRTAEPLRGQTLSIRGLEATLTDALVRIEFADGTSWTRRLTPRSPMAQIPAWQPGWAVALQYTALGVEHILLGIDHLLFVLTLLFVVGRVSGLIKTVTAFTIAHSITLALAALGITRVPQQPVEVMIALSIVFVAAEIVRHRRGGARSLLLRAPWVVAFAFGLLHGFGFAGALAEIGLPQGRIPLALLGFNAGVEIGQLLFIAAAMPAYAVLSRLAAVRVTLRAETVRRMAPAYAIGSVAMFWVIERISAF